jgi:hypothetical protein
MTNERFFRMLSVAVLGLLALAIVPQTGATDAQTEITADQLPIEVTIVREVDEINAGRFNTAQAGEEPPTEPTLLLSPVKTTTLTQFDPNL